MMVDATETAADGAEFRNDLRRRSLPPATVRRLTRLDPWKATAAVLETFAVIAVAVAAALYWWNLWVVAVAVVVIASRQQALFVLAHDAAHYRMYRSRAINDLVGRIAGSVVGISMCTYRVVHRLHHNHLYGAQDPDIPLHGGYPRGRAYLLRKLAKDLAGLTAYKTYAYFFGAPVINVARETAARPLDDTAPALRRAARRDRWLVVGLHVAAPLAAFAAGHLMAYLVLWLLPMATVLQAMLRLRAIAEHGAVTDFSSPLTAARTNLCPAWLAWFLFPHHVNYHVEHHVYPSIPHYNLPACHREMMAAGVLAGAEVRRFGATLRAIFADPRAAPVPVPGD